MSTTIDINDVELEEFQSRVFADLAAGYGGVMISLGAKLGLYAALAGATPLTSADVAQRTGCAERYVREWLNSQAAGGYLDYDRELKTYTLPPERAAVLGSASTTLCCAHALSEGGEALGAQAGGARLADLFHEAGFGDWNVVARTPFNLIAQVRT